MVQPNEIRIKRGSDIFFILLAVFLIPFNLWILTFIDAGEMGAGFPLIDDPDGWPAHIAGWAFRAFMLYGTFLFFALGYISTKRLLRGGLVLTVSKTGLLDHSQSPPVQLVWSDIISCYSETTRHGGMLRLKFRPGAVRRTFLARFVGSEGLNIPHGDVIPDYETVKSHLENVMPDRLAGGL